MRISDWSSDVCSSDLEALVVLELDVDVREGGRVQRGMLQVVAPLRQRAVVVDVDEVGQRLGVDELVVGLHRGPGAHDTDVAVGRSEEHTSELQSLMRISYAVFCLKKKNKQQQHTDT